MGGPDVGLISGHCRCYVDVKWILFARHEHSVFQARSAIFQLLRFHIQGMVIEMQLYICSSLVWCTVRQRNESSRITRNVSLRHRIAWEVWLFFEIFLLDIKTLPIALVLELRSFVDTMWTTGCAIRAMWTEYYSNIRAECEDEEWCWRKQLKSAA